MYMLSEDTVEMTNEVTKMRLEPGDVLVLKLQKPLESLSARLRLFDSLKAILRGLDIQGVVPVILEPWMDLGVLKHSDLADVLKRLDELESTVRTMKR